MSTALDKALDKGMPASPDAERSILGAILLDPNCLYESQTSLRSDGDDFSIDSHRRIFSRMVELGEHAKPIDIITLTEVLNARKELNSVGGVAYIASLTDGVPRRPSIKHYCAIVRDKSILRSLIHMANNIMARSADQGESPSEIMGSVEETLMSMQVVGKTFRSMRELVPEAIDELERLREVTNETLGLTTGFAALNDATTGIREGEIWVIGARPNVGKTPFACQIGLANAKQNLPVGVFSLEMIEKRITLRCMAHAGCAPADLIRDPRRMSEGQRASAYDKAAMMADFPLYVDDTRGISLRDLRAKVRRAVHQMGIKLFILDYLQIMNADGKNQFERVSNAMRGIQMLVGETKVPMVVLSQLNRDAKDPSKPPMLGDLRDSGVVEQDADVVILIHRPPFGDDPSVLSLTGEFIMAKMRDGVCGPEPFDFDPVSLQFRHSRH